MKEELEELKQIVSELRERVIYLEAKVSYPSGEKNGYHIYEKMGEVIDTLNKYKKNIIYS